VNRLPALAAHAVEQLLQRSPGRWRRRRLGVAAGRDHDNRQRRQMLRQVLRQLQCRFVGPLQIVDEDDDRAGTAAAREELQHVREQEPLPQLRRKFERWRHLRKQPVQFGEQFRKLGRAGADRLPERRCRHQPGGVFQDFDVRNQGRCAVLFVAATDQRLAPAPPRRIQCVFGQAGLADAGFSPLSTISVPRPEIAWPMLCSSCARSASRPIRLAPPSARPAGRSRPDATGAADASESIRAPAQIGPHVAEGLISARPDPWRAAGPTIAPTAAGTAATPTVEIVGRLTDGSPPGRRLDAPPPYARREFVP
jgi:hypothetical protein